MQKIINNKYCINNRDTTIYYQILLALVLLCDYRAYMKFTISKKVLEKILAHAVGIVERRPTVAIIGHVLVDASKEQNSISFTATNMDMSIIDKINCEVEESGKYCLPTFLLYDITKKLASNATIDIFTNNDEETVTIKQGKSEFSIHYMQADQFPPIANSDYPVSFDITPSTLKKAIDIAKVSIPQDSTRIHLNGVHVHYENENGADKLRFVSTDLYRIACVSVNVSQEARNMSPVIVPKRAIAEVAKLIDNEEFEQISVSVSETKISFKMQDSNIASEFSTRLINGTFPEYKEALQVSNNKILQADTKEFIAAIDRVSTVVTENKNSIKLSIYPDKIVLSAISRELGQATEEINASFSALETMEICFNSKFLLEIMAKIESPHVKMLLAESSSSAIIEPEEHGVVQTCFAIMPVEIVNE